MKPFRARVLVVCTAGGILAAGCAPAKSRLPEEPAARRAGFTVVYALKLTPLAWERFREKKAVGPLTPRQLPVEALKTVSEQRKISLWRPVVGRPLEEDPAGINRIYLLTADQETDIQATLSSFQALSEWVEYIERSETGD
ncbi:MAG: hypothetical protein NC819_00670 [Candidatus Omnitrophica bacterium]|nr:hypothetical protein [Candidatus Omnitrophota bacterium]